MTRYYNDVGAVFTHDYEGNEVQFITVDTAANGVVVAVTSTPKTIEFLRSGVYLLQADTDVNYTITQAPPDNIGGTATATAATSDDSYFRQDEAVYIAFRKGSKMSVITDITANLEVKPTEK